MLSICICDDNAKDLADIQALVRAFARAHPEFSLQAECFSSSPELLDRLETGAAFDLYLLDILMPQVAGLELARRVRETGQEPEIIFLTASREYALDAFDVAACGYLLKPIQKEALEETMLRAVRRLDHPDSAHLLLRTREGLRKLLFRELVVVESFNHERVCTLTDGSTAVTADTLTSIMERLSGDARFFSPHRAYIINLEQITAIGATHVALSNGQRVPVSRASLGALKRAYMEYLF